jgi:UDP-2-acetamido-3-amino-2,3-dideoxy-glucuronate N-acetyltransferase
MSRDLALIGIGHWGKNLARNFNQLGALHTVCDLPSYQLHQYKALYPQTCFTHDFEEVLNNEEIKKVVLAIPTRLHYQYAKRALENGKDVFVEKAMSENSSQADELCSIAEEKGRILMVGHILHYHPGIERIKEIIQVGDLGDLLHLQFNRLNFGSRGPETSALWAFAPHDISILLSFCQAYTLEELQCSQHSFYSKEHFDQAWISLHFSQNVKATIQVSWMSPIPERRLVIVGTKGTLVFDDSKEWSEKLTFWESSIVKEKGGLQFNQKSEERIMLKPKEPLQEECKHFLNCCFERTPPLTDGFEGAKVMKILDWASMSSKENQKIKIKDFHSELIKS